MVDENDSECSQEVVKFFRNLGIGISDDHSQQYRQIQKRKSDGKDKRKDKRKYKEEAYKLTIERRLDKKHFDAVFRRVQTFVDTFPLN